MAVKIAAWNIEGRLNGYAKRGRGTTRHILQNIAALDADVLVLPEFYVDEIESGARAKLKALGYEIFETPYKDVGRDYKKWGPSAIGILSRLPIKNVRFIRPGNVRNLIVCEVADQKTGKWLRVIATHLDDRSESQRLKQVNELVEIINETNMPTVMLGDFNAMWHAGRGRLLASRSARFAARQLPHEELRGVAVRATDMATGKVLSILTTQTNLRDADTRHRPTTTPKLRDALFLPSIRLIQIDHMLVSPEITVSGFKIGRDGGSDHRSISARLRLH